MKELELAFFFAAASSFFIPPEQQKKGQNMTASNGLDYP